MGPVGLKVVLEVHEVRDGLVEFVPGDPVVIDVDVFEDRLVEGSAGFVAGGEVELVGVFEELQAGLHGVCAGLKVVVDLSSLFGKSSASALDFREFRADPHAREVAVGGELEQVGA